jgi:glycosyltransferase involved in cell wall biosynthesis
MTRSTVHCVLPGDIDDPLHPSGGNIYDRRILDGLTSMGWHVREHAIPGDWPQPSTATQSTLESLVVSLPDEAVVLVDGLVASAAAPVLMANAERVRLVPLIHLPASTPAEGELLRASAAILATSEWTARQLVDDHGLAEVAVHVATPGVEPAPVAAGSADGGSALLCVGAVAPHKGQDVLISACERLPGHVFTCDIVGPLDHDPSFVESLRIRAKPFAPRLRFVGPRTGASLETTYDEADLLVVPSRVETYGMVVTEALARGIPVLATTAGGLPSTLGDPVEDESLPGMLVVPGDADALAGALRHWLTDPALRQRLRDSALTRRATLTDWSHTAAAVAPVLARVHGGG